MLHLQLHKPRICGTCLICFLESKDYADCLKLAISLGGDSDTLAAIAGPMAYAFYREMPDSHVYPMFCKKYKKRTDNVKGEPYRAIVRDDCRFYELDDDKLKKC